VTDLVLRELAEISGKRVAVLGLAYEPDVDDLRESPAIKIARLLQDAGMEVPAFEPNKPDANIPGVTVCQDLESAIRNADILLVLVAHHQLKNLDPQEVARISSAKIVIDAVNVCKLLAWQEAGFKVVKIGAPSKVLQAD
jgi:UDP-N-acetyl-D-mannosaminuronate dehydrogenase